MNASRKEAVIIHPLAVVTIPKHEPIKSILVRQTVSGSDDKTLNEYMKMPYRMEIVEDEEEGGFVVSYPDLPGLLPIEKCKKMH